MKDQLNRDINFVESPKRIISLVPSQTELLVDLGLEPFIVGITKFCVHPKHLRKNTTIVGGTKQVHFDKIKALSPDVILCNKEENTKEMISELEEIATVHISDVYNVEDALDLIQQYGELFSVKENAKRLCTFIENEQEQFFNVIKNNRSLKVVYFIWKNPWMVAANQTFIDSLLKSNGFDNYFGNLHRYPEVQLSNISEDIDLILLSSEPYPFNDNDIEQFRKQFPNVKTILVDGEYFSWFGSRLQFAFRYFKKLHKKI